MMNQDLLTQLPTDDLPLDLPTPAAATLPAPAPAASFRASHPLLLALFFGSGCAALIYEIIWYQMLQLLIGLTALSLGVLLATFMGGMCLGSALLPRLIGPRRHPLRVYALLELGIGVIGLAVLAGMPWVGRLYTTHSGSGASEMMLRAAVAALCLLPPTILMGATLPAVARWVEATPEGVSWLGFFYGGNIAGAVCGCLLAGFYLLRLHDITTATHVAVAINLIVCVLAFFLAARSPHRLGNQESTDSASPHSALRTPPFSSRAVYFTIALSGLTALGAEVVWTRLLSLLLGVTTYTFSIILAVFLIGLGIGSALGSLAARAVTRPRLALAACQFLLTLAIAWSAAMICRSIPYWPINPEISTSPWNLFQLDLLRAAWAILPGAILWGASFPLALAAATTRGQDPGRVAGGVYAANTVGAIIGALAFSMLVIPWLGTQGAQRLMIALAALSALVALAPAWRRAPERSILAVLAAAALAAPLVWSVAPTPWGMIAYGRYTVTYAPHLAPAVTEEALVPQGKDVYPDIYCTYVGEGLDGSVAVTMNNEGVRSFHAAGKIQASSETHDMRLQRMLGHLSALVHSEPKSVLVVACGAGVTAGTFVLYPSVKRIVICDIEPLVPKHVAPRFKTENYDVVNDPRVQIVADDGRHFISTTKEKFDIITSDPIDPWVKGCAALNTVEYFQMCKDHLNPGGVVSQWLPLYESNIPTVKSVVGTFFKVFPQGTIWSNDDAGTGYDTVLIGQQDATRIDVVKLEARVNSADYEPVLASLKDVGFNSALDLLATYAGQAPHLTPWLADAQINNDADLRLQYLAGMGANSYIETEILHSILQYYKFPDNILEAPPALKVPLQRKMKR